MANRQDGGRRPRPRVAFAGSFVKEEVDQLKQGLFASGTVHAYESVLELRKKVSPTECDLLILGPITFGFPENQRYRRDEKAAAFKWARSCHVICFRDDIELPGPRELTAVRVLEAPLETEEFNLPLGLPHVLDGALRRTNFRHVRGWKPLDVILDQAELGGSAGRLIGRSEAGHQIMFEGALVKDRHRNRVLATQYSRNSGLGVAVLPPCFPTPIWVEAITQHWAQQDADRFPGWVDWSSQPDWMTRDERVQQELINAKLRELAEIVKDREREIADLEKRNRDTTRQAGTKRRRLLETKGTELVDEVAKALRALGFEVVDMDSRLNPNDPKREDLRLRDPDDATWEAIAEVKGHESSGGKTNDLLKVMRHHGDYRAETQRPPSRTLFIVNAFFEQMPPEARQQPLAGADLRDFWDIGGVVMSTLDLFRAVEGDHGLDPGVIRESIKTAAERWTIKCVQKIGLPSEGAGRDKRTQDDDATVGAVSE